MDRGRGEEGTALASPRVSRLPVSRMRHAFLLAGFVWLTLHVTGLLGPIADATFVVVGTATLGAVITGLRRHRVTDRRPWFLIVGAFCVWIAGGGLREEYGTLGDLSASRSLLPDVLSLSGYVLLLFGVGAIMQRRVESREFNIDAGLDAIIIALSACAFGWVAIVGPTVRDVHAAPAVEALLITYPALSIIVVSALCRLGFSARMLSIPAYQALVTSMALLLVGDVVYMLVELDVWSPDASLRDLPYAAAFVIFGSGALHPSVRELSRPAAQWTEPTGRWRVRMVALALAAPPVLTFLTAGDAIDRIALGVISLLLTAAAVTRIMRALSAQATVQSRLAHAASHDDLTGLPNRTYLTAHLGQSLYQAVTSERVVGAVLVDIDQFKLVNDGLGHRFGDDLLVAVGARLRSCLRDPDFVAHLGADEFAVISLAEHPDDVRALAESIRASFVTPFRLGTVDVRVSVSVGLNVITSQSPTADWTTMLEDADAALMEAKRTGRDHVIGFHRGLRSEVDRRLQLEQELRKAVEHKSLEVFYQPLVRLPDGAAKGFEALVRWHHPELGSISPVEFIPVAEETGLIIEVGLFVLETSLRQLRQWRNEGLAQDLQMSVNVSPRQMLDAHLRPIIPILLAELDLAPSDLQLEITEGLLVNDPGTARELLQHFRSMGVRVALDDFGTGYSSLAHLKRFPVDVVKIDRSFVTQLGEVPRGSDESLVAAIVAMSNALGLGTLAEGVETIAQADRLFELGVGSAQGFHYARPLPAADVPAWLGRLGTADIVPPNR